MVGGGVIGLATACRLQSRGRQTLLIDPAEVPRGASWGNAGHIATEQVEPLASPNTLRSFPKRLFWRGGALSLPFGQIPTWLPFAFRLVAASRAAKFAAGSAALTRIQSQAMDAWRLLLRDAGAVDLLREDGHYVVWESAATAAEGRRRWSETAIGTTRFRDVTAEELKDLRALVTTPLADAIRFEGTGQIADTGLLAESLLRHFITLGGEHRRATVTTVTMADGKARLRLDDDTSLSADAIVIAAGVRSGPLMRSLGHTVPLIAERGYHIQSEESGWPVDMPPVVFEDRSMIVTRFRSGLRAASFVEFGRVDSPPDKRKWARLRRHVEQLGFAFHMPGSEWIGARPTLPDYLPAIGRSRRAPNLYYAFGHQHLGLTLAAVTGEAIAALVSGDVPPFDVAPFEIERFAPAPRVRGWSRIDCC